MPGRKRGLAVDVLGLVIAVVVLAASAHENTAGIALLDRVAARHRGHRDQGAGRPGVQERGRRAWRRPGDRRGDRRTQPRQQGVRPPQPKRWVVEQTYGILMFHRRLVRDYEHLPASSEARVYWAMTDVMSRRLTRGASPSWRWA
ncbi:transposase [Nonomuraea ferruginea]